jgi:NadR type nicotinamide-nucleotide adenylyltransferase
MPKRISITGPESTGKSWLAKRLAEHFKTAWVHEYSVDYLTDHGAEYSIEDVVEIAKGQLELEENYVSSASGLLFCDTDILVSKIWCQVVFNQLPEWIDKNLKSHKYDLYLLCFPDLSWEDAPFRENPDNRDFLFGLYEKELISLDANYRIVNGQGEQRFINALNFVSEIN